MEQDRGRPLFVRVSSALSGEILAGRLSGKLPTERALCDRFGVSRMTVRKALAALAGDGLITSGWGRGWYAAQQVPLSEPPNSLLSFSTLAAARGLEASSRVLALRERPSSLDEAEELRIAPGAGLFELERLRLLDGVPATVQRSYLPAARVPDLGRFDFTVDSLYRVLEEEYGIIPSRADYAVDARPADDRLAGLLQVAPGTPVLWAAQNTYDQRGRVFEGGWAAYLGDRYRFRATLTRSPVAAALAPRR